MSEKKAENALLKLTFDSVAVIAAAELSDTMPATDKRIAAIKGAFALAINNTDGLADGDHAAAVEAGYANPAVVAGIAEATWLAVEKYRDEAWHKGFDAGYEGKTAVVASEEEWDVAFPKDRWRSRLLLVIAWIALVLSAACVLVTTVTAPV